MNEASGPGSTFALVPVTSQDTSSQGAKLVNRLFDQIFQVMKKYPQTDGILLPIFTRLTRRLLELAASSPSPTGAHNTQFTCLIHMVTHTMLFHTMLFHTILCFILCSLNCVYREGLESEIVRACC